MNDLFRSFSREKVEFLLIGGQASIVYGAAQFTQDFDVWVRPTRANLEALLRALARVRARVHKLTPPVTCRNAKRGHGFHFVVPVRSGAPVPLDVLGRPPRVGGFSAARRRAVITETAWGRLPVVALEDLVRLKRTNRPGDYETIARLVRIRLEASPKPSRALLRWAIENTLEVEALTSVVERHAAALARCGEGLPRAVLQIARRILRGATPAPAELRRLDHEVLRRLAVAICAGRDYWRPILAELREMRAGGVLLREGSSVAGLLQGKSGYPRSR